VRQEIIRIEGISGSFRYVSSLRSLLPFRDFELHRIAFLQAFVSFRTDSAVMHKNIRAVCTADKSITFRIIEPLHRTFQPFHAKPRFPHV
jgi:hypothetical protein